MRFIAFICLLLISCTRKDTLLRSERKVNFSSSSEPDTFILVGRGSDTLNTTMSFIIISANGDTLWKDIFPSAHLIDYGLIESEDYKVTEEEQRTYVGRRIRHFFDDANFTIPAVADSDMGDSTFSYYNVWQDIKLNRAAVGFHYLIGEENNQCIAYSKTKNRVVVYLSFD